MFITIDKRKDEPLYLQIRSQIVAAIARGELTPGASLPSVRALAADLGVNLHTANKAYALLRDEGYVTMMGRSGTIVADLPSPSTQNYTETESRIFPTMKELAFEHCARGGTADSFIDFARRAAEDVYGEPAFAAGAAGAAVGSGSANSTAAAASASQTSASPAQLPA